jgi:hypothetical protein
MQVAAKYNLPMSLDIGCPWRHIELKTMVHEAVVSDFSRFLSQDVDELIAKAHSDENRNYWIARKEKLKTKTWFSDYWGFIAGNRSVYQNFCSLWADKLEAGDPVVIDICSQWQAVSHFFYCVGRLMIPTHGGPQFGEPDYSLVLGQITTDIAQATIKKREE